MAESIIICTSCGSKTAFQTANPPVKCPQCKSETISVQEAGGKVRESRRIRD